MQRVSPELSGSTQSLVPLVHGPRLVVTVLVLSPGHLAVLLVTDPLVALRHAIIRRREIGDADQRAVTRLLLDSPAEGYLSVR